MRYVRTHGFPHPFKVSLPLPLAVSLPLPLAVSVEDSVAYTLSHPLQIPLYTDIIESNCESNYRAFQATRYRKRSSLRPPGCSPPRLRSPNDMRAVRSTNNL